MSELRPEPPSIRERRVEDKVDCQARPTTLLRPFKRESRSPPPSQPQEPTPATKAGTDQAAVAAIEPEHRHWTGAPPSLNPPRLVGSEDWKALPADYAAPLDANLLGEVHGPAKGDPVPGVKPITRLRLDRDLVERFGFKAARLAKYLECWLSGKIHREPSKRQWTYDPRWLIRRRTGLSTAPLFRATASLRDSIVTSRGWQQTLHYAFKDQRAHFAGRARIQRVYCNRHDADIYGEPAAILLFNLRYWATQNKEPWRLYAGRYWRRAGFNELAKIYAGFLSYEQIRDALQRLEESGLIQRLDYFDLRGVRHDDRRWISLADTLITDMKVPDNHVRWDGFEVRVEAQNPSRSRRKTPWEIDQTLPETDQTGRHTGPAESLQPEPLGEIPPARLKKAALNKNPLSKNPLRKNLPQTDLADESASPIAEPAGLF